MLFLVKAKKPAIAGFLVAKQESIYYTYIMASFYRRLFFWICVLLFLATTPVAILYSQGYRFDQYKGIFVHSGSITVKSTPSSVNIFVNGQMRPSGALDIINNSITINGLRPGNYNLRVSADGYADWEKNIEVHSGLSTEFWNVFLAPKNTSPKELAADGAEKYFPAASGKNIAYFKKNGSSLEIWDLNVANANSNLISSQENLDFSNDSLDNIEWNSKEKLFTVPVLKDGRKDFLILDSEKSQDPIFLSQAGLADFSGINHARWSPDNQNEVYFIAKPAGKDQNNLYRVDLAVRKPELIAEGIGAYDLSGSSIYLLKQNGIIYKTDQDGKNEDQITLSPVGFSASAGDARLIAYDDYRQAILSGTGELFVHNNGDTGETLEKIADTAKGAQFSNDGKKLLYWSENEIDVIYLRKWDVQPRREENEIQQIIRFSTPIKNVFWYRDYEHVFFSAQNVVKLVELDPRDHRALTDLFRYNSDSFLSSYDSANGIYYFLDEMNGTKKLFLLNIPEQTNFFGG